MRNTICWLAALGAGLIPSNATAQNTFPPIYILAEDGTAENAACNAEYPSAVAAISAALRYNRVSLATREDSMQNRALMIYVNINAQEDVMENGRRLESCGVALTLSLRDVDAVVNRVDGQRYMAIVEYCGRGTLLAWNRSTMQTAINNKLREYVDECLAQYVERRLPS